ncbi:MAG TPA: sigma-70 family RNA polymerase sigma factor [Candidatus Baltobacteraceae bacterium]|nr:sigma-70 family RNA polymerase sigma factor [Candidatus Baltobacteraceae bacterium]
MPTIASSATTKAPTSAEREIMAHVRAAGRGVSRTKPVGGAAVHADVGLALAVDPPELVAPVDDQALISAAAAGDGAAFGELVTRYERAVYHLAVRTLRDATEAEDAAQEAFIKAYRALGSFRPGAKFSTWIFTICYRCCCDRIAKRKRLSRDELPDRADPSAGPELLAERNDEARRLRTAIDALPEKYRAVVTLYHLQGKQYDEIASVLNLPLGTVKTHLFRAKEQLRKALTA